MQLNSDVFAPAIVNIMVTTLKSKLFETKSVNQLITGYKGMAMEI